MPAPVGKSRRERRQVWVSAALIAVTLAGGGAYVAVSRHTRPLCPDGGATCTVQAPLSSDLGDEIYLAPMLLHVSPGALRVVVSGRLTHRGNTELELARYRMLFLDESGNQVGEKTIDVQTLSLPPLRPGDTHTFYHDEDAPVATRSARLVAGERRSKPAAATYGKGQTIPVAFVPRVPSRFRVGVTYRARKVGDAVIDVVNEGEGIIRVLELHLESVAIVGEPQTLAYAMMPPMLPGERRVTKLHVTGDVVSEKVVVTKVE